tara:strand:- start:571 stop:741 length:171 start_codon:yes stop_codon:yes gene_type:complete
VQKINIQFLGHKQYLAEDIDAAKKQAIEDLKYIHPSLGLQINGHMVLVEDVAKENE